jgi:hypothetical protein
MLLLLHLLGRMEVVRQLLGHLHLLALETEVLEQMRLAFIYAQDILNNFALLVTSQII